jgi:hypothetical protein
MRFNQLGRREFVTLLVVLRPHGRSRHTRSKPLNFTALAFYLRNSHPLDFLTLFGKDFASLVMLRGGTSR